MGVNGSGKGSWQNPAKRPRKASKGPGTVRVPAGKQFRGNSQYGYLSTDPKQYPSTKGKKPSTGSPKVLKPAPKPRPQGSAGARTKKAAAPRPRKK